MRFQTIENRKAFSKKTNYLRALPSTKDLQ